MAVGATLAMALVAASCTATPENAGSGHADATGEVSVDGPRQAGEPDVEAPTTDDDTASDASTDPDEPAASPTPPTPADADAAPTIAWASCGQGLECGTVTVPVDHRRPAGPTLTLAVARRPAPGESAGAVITNPGGPGASGVDWLRRGMPLPTAVAEHFDVVTWDPRGVGGSAALDCNEPLEALYELDPSPDTVTEQTAIDEAAVRAARHCDDRAGNLLAHMGTDATVADLETLRRALGDEPLRYVGFSYGTVIGLRYLQTHPDRVGALVLDGVADPDLDRASFLTDQAVAFEATLDRVLASCAQRRPCPLADPAATIDAVFAAAEAAPFDPSDTDPTGTEPQLGPATVPAALLVALYEPAGHGALIDALAAWEAGDAAALVGLADAFRAFGGWDAYTATSCVDAPGPTSAAAHAALADTVADRAPRLGPAAVNELAPCAVWPVDPVEWETLGPTSAPVLLTTTTGDPATPLAWARRVHARLQGAALAVLDGEGHTAIGRSTCIDDAVTALLIDGVAPAAPVVQCP